jgi:hypothetical protein
MTNESHIDEVLSDYARDHQPADPAGTEGLNNIMAEAKQVKDAAMIARFTEEEAFQFARDYMAEMFRVAAQTMLRG